MVFEIGTVRIELGKTSPHIADMLKTSIIAKVDFIIISVVFYTFFIWSKTCKQLIEVKLSYCIYQKQRKSLIRRTNSDSQNAKMPKKQPSDANLSFTKSKQGF